MGAIALLPLLSCVYLLLLLLWLLLLQRWLLSFSSLPGCEMGHYDAVTPREEIMRAERREYDCARIGRHD